MNVLLWLEMDDCLLNDANMVEKIVGVSTILSARRRDFRYGSNANAASCYFETNNNKGISDFFWETIKNGKCGFGGKK